MHKAAPVVEPIADRGAAISEGMKELAEVRTKAREKRNGTPAKPLVFSEFLKTLLAGKSFDAEAIVKRFPDVKISSVKSWVSHWTRNAGTGDNGFPSNARSKEVQSKLKAAIKEAAVA